MLTTKLAYKQLTELQSYPQHVVLEAALRLGLKAFGDAGTQSTHADGQVGYVMVRSALIEASRDAERSGL